ncbi:MAG: PPOX class F420-dependent oxidoreductase [Mycobacteriales bacterium]
MDLDTARAFLTEHHRAVLVTRRADGGVQTSPVVVAPDAAGRVLVSTRTGSAKERNLTRDPRAALCVLTDAFFGAWVHVEGEAEVVRQPEALPLLEDYYRAVSGEHPDWDDYRRAMVTDERVLVRITPTRAAGS